MEEILKYVWAFIVGGTICVIAQILIDKTKLTPARILVLYVTAGVVLTAIRVYEPLVQFAGAGATVPLTGFGYSLAKGVEKAVDERGLIGALTGGLTATSAGIAAAMCFGWLVSVCFKGKPKS
ncbi:MAG: stage V sporulation protein AE [Candidatus Flemingibacterium sp.]|nr:stage V sporulation protein AE [Candidatus Flemingibacterium sp.]